MNHSKINKPIYLSIENILLIHSALIDEIGGSHGLRDMTRLQALVEHPKHMVFGKELFATPFQKAACYGFDIIKYHPFVDGNKRSGMVSMGTFLELNGFILEVKEGEIEKVAIEIATDHKKMEDIALWLKKNSKKI